MLPNWLINYFWTKCLNHLLSAYRQPDLKFPEDYSSVNAGIHFWKNLTGDTSSKESEYNDIEKGGVGKCPHQKHFSEEKCLRVLLDGSNSIKNFDQGKYWTANLSSVAIASGLWNIQVIQFSDKVQNEAFINNDNDAARMHFKSFVV